MSPKAIIISLLVIISFVVGIAFILTAGQKTSSPPATFSSQDVDRPQAEIGQALFDLGEIKVSDVKQQDFTLKNIGSRPLQILNVNSSCGCTAGQIIYQGVTSKEYSMHAQGSGYVTEIAPGDEATVRLIYRPAIMPVYGAVEREVYISTNDPIKPKLVFSIKAVVK
ncbi:MAG: DUF1573 domain-containing protein [Patescibacteria group bacterium]